MLGSEGVPQHELDPLAAADRVPGHDGFGWDQVVERVGIGANRSRQQPRWGRIDEPSRSSLVIEVVLNDDGGMVAQSGLAAGLPVHVRSPGPAR